MIADLIVGIIILLLTLRGFFRGLIREVLFIVAGIGGFFLAGVFWRMLDSNIRGFFPSASTSHFASYVLAFVVSFVVILIAGHLIRKVLHLTLLMWVDKIGGGVVGFLKGVIICGALLVLVTFFWPGVVGKGSRISPYVMGFTQRLSVFVPERIRKEFKKDRKHITKYFSEEFWYKLFNIKKGRREL